MSRRGNEFQTIRSEGGLLPPDLLRRVLEPRSKLPGTQPEDYGLSQGERLNEVITQSWNRLRRHWEEFRAATASLPDGEAGTGLTNDKWSLPLLRELGFGFLPTTAGPEVGGRSYAISRFFGPVPVHLIGCGLSLDRRAAGQRGAAAANPHGLVQEFLNRSPDHLWAIVSNGLRFRVLRDNQALSRQSFLEFDLESMFQGEVYSDFVLLWLMAHATRFAPREGERPDTCWLEQWTKEAEEQGARALGDLRGGVERALQILGEGFTSHPKNTALRDALRTGQLALPDFHGQLLRVVYRLIFLFVAEDRTIEGQPLLHPRDDSDAARRARERYGAHYGTARLRDLAGKIKGSRHGDLWRQFQLVVNSLSGDDSSANVRQQLALPALGSFLWNPGSTTALNDAELTNYDFLEALRHLAFTRLGKVLRPVDYKNLGAEELGGVYESLLALTPQISADGIRFGFAEFAGNERKTSGSYYTPESLVQCLLDSALDPVVEEAIKGKSGVDAEKAILALKVCDPAVGSGHFLVGAAHRLARHLARVRALAQGESEPSPLLYQHALRDVIGRCLYGVDVNPMAAELCRIGLWLEALEPGKPLSFLDSHIQCGNALFGAELSLISEGPLDVAWTALKGEDKRRATSLKSANHNWRQTLLFDAKDAPVRHVEVRQLAAEVESFDDESIESVHRKEELWREVVNGDAGRHATLLADLWCASFVWPKHNRDVEAAAPVRSVWESVKRDAGTLRQDTAEVLADLKRRFRFFHWYLAFPTVMERGGFDVVLGNPPWDTLSPDRREFFGQHHPGIRSLSPEEQEAVIDELTTDAAVAARWERHQLELFGLVHFLKNSGRYTLYAPGNLGKGDFNIYRMFAELALKYTRPGGYAAQILPGGLYGGANASAIRRFMFDECELAHLWGLSNTQRGWFGQVDIDRFAAYAAKRGSRTVSFLAHFGLMSPADLAEPAIELDADFIRISNPDTYTIPDIRSVADLTVAQKMQEAYPAFGDESAGPPHRHYQAELHMGNDRDLFTTDSTGLPVYEGRMISHFDHRAKTYASGHGNSSRWIERTHDDPEKAIVPQWRVLPANVPDKLGNRCERYRLAFGDVANPRNERSFTAALVPPGVICGHTVPTIVFSNDEEWMYLSWLAVGNSFVMDWFTRKKLSSPHLTFSVMDSLPFPRPVLAAAWVQEAASLVLRLICTAPEMTPFWNQMAKLGLCQPAAEGSVPSEALLVEAERDLARAQLDALVACDVYGLTRKELSDVLETFPVVKKRDIKAHGEYRTKRLILEAFDERTKVRTGKEEMPASSNGVQAGARR